MFSTAKLLIFCFKSMMLRRSSIKTHTGLPKEEFKASFSAFSAMSYLDQKFSFDAASLEKTAEIALKYTLARNGGPARGITPKQFVDDLQESVCMLQPDGLETTFVHRSFQEYFAAAFVTGLHGSKIKKYWTVVLFGLETR